MKYIATLRCTISADDELEARLVAHEITEAAEGILEEDDTLDVTQIIPFEQSGDVEPTEMVNVLRQARNMLIRTRIVQCYEQARELDKIAWILEHRAEESFDLAGYDYTAMIDLTDRLLRRTGAYKREG